MLRKNQNLGNFLRYTQQHNMWKCVNWSTHSHNIEGNRGVKI